MRSRRSFGSLTSCWPAVQVSAIRDVSGPALYLIENESDVLADDAEKEQLHAAEETHGGNQ
jgi:hypothetical protein